MSGDLNLPTILPHPTDLNEWVDAGRRLHEGHLRLNWLIGDWWAAGEAAFGGRAKAAAENVFGKQFQTLMNIASVARKFDTSRRREALTFGHHEAVAALPPEEADALLDKADLEGWTVRDVRAAAKQEKNRVGQKYDTCTTDDLHALVRRGDKFGSIYADPPWVYDNQGTRAAQGNHYGGLTVDQLCELPVRELAGDDAHLHLWTTNAFLFDCARIFEAWGFEFRSSFVWVKPQMGIGNYWRNSHEFLLTGIRGNAKRFNDRSLMSWLECDRSRHSEKPFIIRDYIRRASPGPYLEMFARTPAEGWTCWGNEIERGLLFPHAEAI